MHESGIGPYGLRNRQSEKRTTVCALLTLESDAIPWGSKDASTHRERRRRSSRGSVSGTAGKSLPARGLGKRRRFAILTESRWQPALSRNSPMPLSALKSPEQLGVTAADGGRRRPGWRRERIVWVFQVLFWLAVGATLSGFSVALRPDEPLPWGAIGLRVVTGFTVSSLIDMLFRLPALRALPRSQRWPLLVIVALLGMAMSLATALLLLCEGPMIRQTGMALPTFAPRLVAALM